MIRAPPRKHPRTAIAHWPANRQSRTDQIHRRPRIKRLPVAIQICNIQHTRQTVAIPRGKRPLNQCDILQCIGIKRAKKPEQMIRIINHHVIKQNQILPRRAPAHIQTRGIFTRGLHARKQLNTAHQIGLSHRRNTRQFRHPRTKRTHRRHLSRRHALAYGLNLLSHQFRRFQLNHNPRSLAPYNHNLNRPARIADITRRNPVQTRRQIPNHKITGLIRRHTNVQTVNHNIGIRQSLAIGSIADSPPHRPLTIRLCTDGKTYNAQKQLHNPLHDLSYSPPKDSLKNLPSDIF